MVSKHSHEYRQMMVSLAKCPRMHALAPWVVAVLRGFGAAVVVAGDAEALGLGLPAALAEPLGFWKNERMSIAHSSRMLFCRRFVSQD